MAGSESRIGRLKIEGTERKKRRQVFGVLQISAAFHRGWRCVPRGNRKTPGHLSGSLSVHLDRSGDLTGTHTPGTNINMAGGTVHDCLHTLHIGLPCTIGTPMRVGDLNAERYALVAELALCHPLHLLAVA